MIEVKISGDFGKTESFLNRAAKGDISPQIEAYGNLGVQALQAATPMDSGETARSWYYEVKRKPGQIRIIWKNSHIVKGVPIAIILQYGHGTGTGGYVQGRDYINPAIQPVFDQIVKEIEKEIARG